MTKNNKSTYLLEIKCVRALDSLISGTFMIGLFMFFSPILMALPIKLIRYLYLLPIIFVVIVIFSIPKDLHTTEKWYDALGRLRFFAVIALGLAPFWKWWHSNMNSLYLMINIAFFILALVMCLYNMVSIVSAATEDDNKRFLLLFTRFLRLVLIYFLVAPVLAFLITFCLGLINGIDIFILLFQIKSWDMIIFGIPFIMTIYSLWLWRNYLVKHITSEKLRDHNCEKDNPC